MEVLPRFQERDTGTMCKLKQAVCGLKQSLRAWFGRFSKPIKSMGYAQRRGDHTLFFKHSGKKVTALLVYVDNIVVTGSDMEE